MRFAVDMPNFGLPDEDGNAFGDPLVVAELAHEAEESGWDGFFIWDHIGADWPVPISDPWVLLAAAAMRTSTIKLGPMVTPLPRRRPWKVARETVTLDRLSNGRLIMGVGLGGGNEYTAYDESGDARVHGAMLDEALDVLTGLWSGEPFRYAGTYYQLENVHFLPKPVQSRIPIWVAGLWPNKKPFHRAAAYDGVFPLGRGLSVMEQMTPQEMREVTEYMRSLRKGRPDAGPFDVVQCGFSGGDPGADREMIDAYAEAGVTWWFENFHGDRGTFKEQRARIRQGPPPA